MTISIQCISCAHYRLNLKCDAFPHGIPNPILEDEHDHRKPFFGDNGVRFELAEGMKNPFEDGEQ